MLGPFSVLNFLEGWEFRNFQISAVCLRGAIPTEVTLNQFGWLSEILLLATDCYGTITVTPQHKQQTPPFSIYPELAKGLGIVAGTPGGFLAKYYRPDSATTFGVYTLVIQAGVEAAPFAAPTKIEVSLPDNSTQPSALVSAVANIVQLTDRDAFLKSLADLPVSQNADLAAAVRSLVKTLEAAKR